jgi:sugar (pentulose or hexulose) kinase
VRRDILAIDVGTSALKIGVFGPDLERHGEAQRAYAPHIYDRGKADIEPDAWWEALRECCAEVSASLAEVGVLSLSVTTPGLTPMAADGTALAPAVLFLDRRSHAQSATIRRVVGEERFLAETCNLPVSGGSSLSSILWFRDELPDVWAAAAKFGHCNTYLVKRMTGRWAIDPSTTSITGLYNTARNDLTWNRTVLGFAGIPEDKLPPLMQSYERVGRLLPAVADELGLPRGCSVLCGGNDAVLAALSGGLTEPGDINIISGTCDIASVCTDGPIASPSFNVRCHVVPGRWLTFFVLNAGGEALEWLRRVAFRELGVDQFYGDHVPHVIDGFFGDPDPDAREAELPEYVPYLGGSRYSLEPLKAVLSGLTLETTREDLLLSVIRGNAVYLGEHLRSVAELVPMGRRIGISGGGARIRGMLEARRRWTGAYEYVFQDQSSLLGAAILGQINQSGRLPGFGQVTTGSDSGPPFRRERHGVA